jgi:WXG100 family type VII secretion target
MAKWSGANVANLEGVAADMRSTAAELTTALAAVKRLVDEMWWQGDDADAFRADWRGSHLPKFQRILTELNSTSDKVRSQAEAQRKVSGD